VAPFERDVGERVVGERDVDENNVGQRNGCGRIVVAG